MKFFSERSLKLIKLYSWNTIFFKYFKKSVIYILAPLIILSLAICYYTFHSTEEELINNQSRAFYQTTSLLETVFRDIENHHLIISDSADIMGYCTLKEENTAEKYSLLIATQKHMANTNVSSQYINNVHLFKVGGDYVLSTLNGNYLDSFHLKKWHDIYSKEGISEFICYESPKVNNANTVVTVVKGLQKDGQLYGIVIYELNSYVLEGILEKNDFSNNTQILYDRNGKIFFSNDKNLIEKNVSEIADDAILKDFESYEKKGNTVFFKSNIDYAYNFVSKANIRESMNIGTMVAVLLFVVLLVLVISFVLSFYLSLQFYQSIIEITATLRDDQESSGEISQNEFNELYYINSHIVSRLTKKADIEKNLAEQIIALKKAQFIALQTQLNPHFIYNTLNLINVMVMNISKKDCDASRAIVILSQLLREMLDTKKYLVSLSDEIEYTKKYIALQQLKHNYKISVVWNIDSSLNSHNVLKFMLQPIVENAFEHGFDHTVSDCYNLEISASQTDEFIKISVSNNGKSIEDDTLKTLQADLGSGMIFEQKGIGLMNVNHRIRLIYGDTYGCTIESDKNITTVHITLPSDDTAPDFPILNK